MSRHFMSLKTCSTELGITDRYLRRLFSDTNFQPAMRVHQRAFYMPDAFEDWKEQYWSMCTGERMS